MAQDNFVFAGQKDSIGRSQTQVYGITDKRDFSIRRAQTLGINSTVSQNATLQNFSNPMRDPRDIALQQMQRGDAAPPKSNIKVHMPVAQRTATVVVRNDGTIANNDKLFKELKGIVRSIFFGLTVIVGLLFAYLAFEVFIAFETTTCGSGNNCQFSHVSSSTLQYKIVEHGITIMTDECDNDGFYILYRINRTDNTNSLIEYSFNNLYNEMDNGNLITDSFYITQINSVSYTCVTSHSSNFNGYTIISEENSDSESIWYENGAWPILWIAVSWIYLLFIIGTEWVFWSYSTEFTKKIDSIAMLMWGLMRFANYSFMFTIALTYSLLVTENKVAYIIGSLSPTAVDLCMVTGFIVLIVPLALASLFLLCLCLALCCSETDANQCRDCGCNVREFHDSCCSPCGEWFIPYSRFTSNHIINDNEQCIGDAMCYFMTFGLVLAIAGFISLYTFLDVLFDGSYFHDGSAAALYFGTLMIAIFETIWFFYADKATNKDLRQIENHNDNNSNNNGNNNNNDGENNLADLAASR